MLQQLKLHPNLRDDAYAAVMSFITWTLAHGFGNIAMAFCASIAAVAGSRVANRVMDYVLPKTVSDNGKA